MNVFDYLHWRKDLTFEEKEMNEVDALVFSLLSYEAFDDLFKKKDSYTLEECADCFFSMYEEVELHTRKTFSYRSYQILKEMAYSKRYKDLVLSAYVNEIDNEIDLQFSALTLTYKDQWKFLVYRGTDDNFAGWKEDFSMFYNPIIEGQKKALEYLQKEKHSTHKLYIGGHSKGGNLAVYASVFALEEIQDRIVSIYSFDGPGVHKKMVEFVENTELASKIHIYLPEESFFGRWLYQVVEPQIVCSEGKGLKQHSLYNWKIEVEKFVYGDTLSEKSNRVIERLDDVIHSHTKEVLKNISDNVFDVFEELQIYTIKDFSEMNFSLFLKAVKEVSNLDGKTKNLVHDLLSLMLDYSFK